MPRVRPTIVIVVVVHRCTNDDPGGESNQRAAGGMGRWRRGRLSVHHLWIVLRNIYHLRVRRLDHYDLIAARGLLSDDLLLLIRLQVTHGLRLLPQALDGF